MAQSKAKVPKIPKKVKIGVFVLKYEYRWLFV